MNPPGCWTERADGVSVMPGIDILPRLGGSSPHTACLSRQSVSTSTTGILLRTFEVFDAAVALLKKPLQEVNNARSLGKAGKS